MVVLFMSAARWPDLLIFPPPQCLNENYSTRRWTERLDRLRGTHSAPVLYGCLTRVISSTLGRAL